MEGEGENGNNGNQLDYFNSAGKTYCRPELIRQQPWARQEWKEIEL